MILFHIPDDQSILYAYQPLIAAFIALIAAILAFLAARYSAQISIKKTKRAILDFCIHLNQDLHAELEVQKDITEFNFHGVKFLRSRLNRYDPSIIITTENITNLSGDDLAIALRINGLLQYLLSKIDDDLHHIEKYETEKLNEEHFLEWLKACNVYYIMILEQILKQTEWMKGVHTGLANRIKYARQSNKT